jgi:hypothetical protein
MEDWKGGRLEDWKIGRVDGWRGWSIEVKEYCQGETDPATAGICESIWDDGVLSR